MNISLICIIFFLELVILFHVSRRVEYYNPIMLFIALPMFYANSLFLDYVISGNGFLELQVLEPTLSVHETNYLIIVFLTFLYVLGVYAASLLQGGGYCLLVNKKRNLAFAFNKENYHNRLGVVFIFASLVYMMLLIGKIYGLGRDEIKALANPVSVLMTQTLFIFLCFSLMYKWRVKFLNMVILVVLLTYSILSFERENILFVIFSLIVNFWPKRLSLKHVFWASLLLLLMIYYKPIVWAVIYYIRGSELDYILTGFFENVVRLTHVDPAASLLMQSDFIGRESIYQDYYGSYLVNTFMQILRVFLNVDWLSLGEFSTEYYTQGNMGMAFSMILESVLNFWYIGPFVLGFIITVVFFQTEKFSNIYYRLHHFIWMIFMLKLVRTELAVVLKLYILPACIAYVIFVWLSKNKLRIPN